MATRNHPTGYGRRRTGKSSGRPGNRSAVRQHRDVAPKTGDKRPDNTLKIVERKPLDWPGSPTDTVSEDTPKKLDPNRPFRILIAVHRPRFRGRTQRAAALVGWEVVSLLNKQDPVGSVAKPPAPPDLLILSGDFGRQKDYAIFRAVQRWRAQGMKLIGMVEDSKTAPEGHPDSAPEKLCDLCLEPPYKTADLRALFSQLYTEMRGRPAPPPIKASEVKEEDEDGEPEED